MAHFGKFSVFGNFLQFIYIITLYGSSYQIHTTSYKFLTGECDKLLTVVTRVPKMIQCEPL